MNISPYTDSYKTVIIYQSALKLNIEKLKDHKS